MCPQWVCLLVPCWPYLNKPEYIQYIHMVHMPGPIWKPWPNLFRADTWIIQIRLTWIPWTSPYLIPLSCLHWLYHDMLAGLNARTSDLNLTVAGIGSQGRKHSTCVTWKCVLSAGPQYSGWAAEVVIAYPGKSANNDLLQIEMRAHQGLHQNLSSFPGKKRSDLAECLQE